MRHVIVPEDLSAADISAVFTLSQTLQTQYEAGVRESLLPGRVLGLVFEKPSLRTRVSFQAAMVHLGGDSLFLGEDTGFASSRLACRPSADRQYEPERAVDRTRRRD